MKSARETLLANPSLSSRDRDVLNRVSLKIHSTDNMLLSTENPPHYLSVGLSALNCIRRAIELCPSGVSIERVLDFPSGYGRVLRFLVTEFPQAQFMGADIDTDGLKFCKENFSIQTATSRPDIAQLKLPMKFNLIWCGSLLTHLTREDSQALLQFFFDHLDRKSVCVFSMHGLSSVELLRTKQSTYGISSSGVDAMLSEFDATGYGYADYPKQSGYGISIASPERMRQMTGSISGWKEVMFSQRGWDNHHDVYAYYKE